MCKSVEFEYYLNPVLSSMNKKTPSFSIPNEPQGGWRYWVLRVGRDGSAISLFIALSLIAIFATRVAPAMLALAILFVVLAHLTVFRQLGFSRILLKRPSYNRLQWAEYPSIPAMLLLSWASVSLIWSPLPLDGAKTLLTIVLILISVRILVGEYKLLKIMSLRTIILAGLILPCLYLVYEALYSPDLFRFFNDYFRDGGDKSGRTGRHDLVRVTILIVLLGWSIIFPPKVSLKTIVTAVLYFILISSAIYDSTSQSTQVSFLLTSVSGLLLIAFPILRRWFFIGMAALIILFPLIVPQLDRLEPLLNLKSVNLGKQMPRVYIWQSYNKIVSERPIIGWGGNADKYFGSLDLNSEFVTSRSIKRLQNHPHNFILQIWVNYGFIGAVLLAWLIFAAGEYFGRLPRRACLLATLFLLSIYIFAVFSYSFYQTWWMATIGIAAIPIIVFSDELSKD